MEEILIRYAHFLGIISLGAMLAVQNVLFSKTLTRQTLTKLSVIDGVYGFSAVVTLVAGLLLWLSVGKPSEFYTSNGLFHAKLGLFIVIAVISIVPTLFLLKNRKIEADEVSVPTYVIVIKRVEMGLLLLLPLLAVLMARGYGAAY